MNIDKDMVDRVVSEVVKRLREEEARATPAIPQVRGLPCAIDIASAAFKRVILFRVDPGCDLMESLAQRFEEEKMKAGVLLFMVGTLREARVGFFVSSRGRFHVTKFAPEDGLELLSGSGTIGMQEGALMPHIHICVADSSGQARGGHLFPGTIVKEYVEGAFTEMEGVEMERIFREEVKAFPLFFDGERLVNGREEEPKPEH